MAAAANPNDGFHATYMIMLDDGGEWVDPTVASADAARLLSGSSVRVVHLASGGEVTPLADLNINHSSKSMELKELIPLAKTTVNRIVEYVEGGMARIRTTGKINPAAQRQALIRELEQRISDLRFASRDNMRGLTQSVQALQEEKARALTADKEFDFAARIKAAFPEKEVAAFSVQRERIAFSWVVGNVVLTDKVVQTPPLKYRITITVTNSGQWCSTKLRLLEPRGDANASRYRFRHHPHVGDGGEGCTVQETRELFTAYATAGDAVGFINLAETYVGNYDVKNGPYVDLQTWMRQHRLPMIDIQTGSEIIPTRLHTCCQCGEEITDLDEFVETDVDGYQISTSMRLRYAPFNRPGGRHYYAHSNDSGDGTSCYNSPEWWCEGCGRPLPFNDDAYYTTTDEGPYCEDCRDRHQEEIDETGEGV